MELYMLRFVSFRDGSRRRMTEQSHGATKTLRYVVLMSTQFSLSDYSDCDEEGYRYEDGPHYKSSPEFIRKSFWPHWHLDATWVKSAGLCETDKIGKHHNNREYGLWREIGLAFPKEHGVPQPISLTLSPSMRYNSHSIEYCLCRLTELTTLNIDLREIDGARNAHSQVSDWFGLLKHVLPQIRHLIISRKSDYLDELSEWLTQMPQLESLRVNYVASSSSRFQLELDLLTNLRQLYIRSSSYYDQKRSPDRIYIPPLPNLIHLDVEECSADEVSRWLPNLATMTALETLRIYASAADCGALGDYLPTQLRSLSFTSPTPLPSELSLQLCLSLQSYTNLTDLPDTTSPFSIQDRELRLQWMNWYANSAVTSLKCSAKEKSGEDMIWPETIPPMKHLRYLNCSHPSTGWASMVSRHTQLTWLSLWGFTLELNVLQKLNQLQQLFIYKPVSGIPAEFFQLVWPELTDLKAIVDSDDLVPHFYRFMDNHPLLSRLDLTLGLQSEEGYMAFWNQLVQYPQLTRLVVDHQNDSAGERCKTLKLDSISPNLRWIKRIRRGGGRGEVVLPDYHELEVFDQLLFEGNEKKHQTLRGLLIQYDDWGFNHVRRNRY